jgi:type IV pilus assembly protein PilC
MSVFTYKAQKEGRIVSGTLHAGSKDEVIRILNSRNITVISVKKNFFSIISGGTKLRSQEMVNFFSSISAMDKVGIDILKSMELMKDEIAPTANLRFVCGKIYSNIMNGDAFSVACKKASKSFTDDFVGLMAIAEKTGKFSSVFDEIVDYIKWTADISSRSKKAIRGPIATLIFMLILTIVMSTVALPKIIDFLKYFNMEPPLYTVALIVFATFVKTYWPAIVAFVVLTPIVTTLIGKAFVPFAIKRDRIKLFIPIFGSLNLKIDTSRFIAFFSLMYNSGAEMLDIIYGVSKVVKNKYLEDRIIVIHQKVLNGSTAFRAIDEEEVFPIMFRRMMSICEVTGEAGPVLENVRQFYDKETKETIDNIIGIIKPTMTVLLGGFLLWMGSAMLGPIYTNIGNFGNSDSGKSNSKDENS